MSVNYPGGRALPPGGDPGDVLTKSTSSDQDAAWEAPGGGGLTNPVTEPLVLSPVGEEEPSLLIEMSTSDQSAETATAFVVRTSLGDDAVSITDPTANGLVVIDPSRLDVPIDGLRVLAPTGAAALYTSLGDGDITVIDRLAIRSDGGDSGAGVGVDLISTDRRTRVATAPDDQVDPAPGGVFRVLYGGAVVTGQAFAPADADIAVRQVAMWFDSSNGAAKVMFKGKTANGTVVVGEVALT